MFSVRILEKITLKQKKTRKLEKINEIQKLRGEFIHNVEDMKNEIYGGSSF